jgi:serine/threonine protein kinase
MTRDLKKAVLLPILLATSGANAPALRAVDRPLGRIGPYRIVAELGSGGMGTVYLGEQLDPIVRRAAVKVARDDAGIDELRARFLAERQLLAVVQHEHIATLYEVGTTVDGDPWFAMEYVPGEPITSYCDRNRLDLDARLLLFAQVCDAVQHLHRLGIEHRDLKPDNVLVVERDGKPVPKLIDLGLAVVRGHHGTDDGLCGTPTHMAPEQFTRPPEDVDRRADVHALGVLLYELVVGALPFAPVDWTRSGGEIELSRGMAPPAPSERLRDADVDALAVSAARGTTERGLERALRGRLDRIASSAVASDREQRPADAGSLGRSVREHLERTAWRGRAVAGALAAAVVAAVAFAAGALVGGIG